MKKQSLNETNDDVNFARCRYCGFPLDKSRDKTVMTKQVSYTAPVGATDPAAPYEATIRGGCPKCGCPQPYSSGGR